MLADTSFGAASNDNYDNLSRSISDNDNPAFGQPYSRGSALQTMKGLQQNGIGTPYVGQPLVPGQMVWTPSMGGGFGHAMRVGPKGGLIDDLSDGGEVPVTARNLKGGWVASPPEVLNHIQSRTASAAAPASGVLPESMPQPFQSAILPNVPANGRRSIENLPLIIPRGAKPYGPFSTWGSIENLPLSVQSGIIPKAPAKTGTSIGNASPNVPSAILPTAPAQSSTTSGNLPPSVPSAVLPINEQVYMHNQNLKQKLGLPPTASDAQLSSAIDAYNAKQLQQHAQANQHVYMANQNLRQKLGLPPTATDAQLSAAISAYNAKQQQKYQQANEHVYMANQNLKQKLGLPPTASDAQLSAAIVAYNAQLKRDYQIANEHWYMQKQNIKQHLGLPPTASDGELKLALQAYNAKIQQQRVTLIKQLGLPATATDAQINAAVQIYNDKLKSQPQPQWGPWQSMHAPAQNPEDKKPVLNRVWDTVWNYEKDLPNAWRAAVDPIYRYGGGFEKDEKGNPVWTGAINLDKGVASMPEQVVLAASKAIDRGIAEFPNGPSDPHYIRLGLIPKDSIWNSGNPKSLLNPANEPEPADLLKPPGYDQVTKAVAWNAPPGALKSLAVQYGNSLLDDPIATSFNTFMVGAPFLHMAIPHIPEVPEISEVPKPADVHAPRLGAKASVPARANLTPKASLPKSTVSEGLQTAAQQFTQHAANVDNPAAAMSLNRVASTLTDAAEAAKAHGENPARAAQAAAKIIHQNPESTFIAYKMNGLSDEDAHAAAQ